MLHVQGGADQVWSYGGQPQTGTAEDSANWTWVETVSKWNDFDISAP